MLLCLVPAFFIAGGISVFVSQTSVMKYLGAGARKVTAYGVASVSGTVLAVCSCTVLPLFAGIYGMGAGLGPATAFLYSGPAINVLAIILTARVLGVEIGVARAVGAIVFSVVIGLLMHCIFRREERRAPRWLQPRCPWKTRHGRWAARPSTFAAMIAVLVFANWGGAGERLLRSRARRQVVAHRGWPAPASASSLVAWYGLPWWKAVVVAAAAAGRRRVAPATTPSPPSPSATLAFSWAVATIARRTGATGSARAGASPSRSCRCCWAACWSPGCCSGGPGHEGLIPSQWIARRGRRQLAAGANLFASVVGRLHVLRDADRGARSCRA